ncbi:glycine--tRNA ligase subunit beta [Arsenophonus symbiont of Ornithomya chloropus]|uniref:glycine--tRNA ligase subunit beta n=1 Tax=Arsenophonus symbiont of Ornithomya chloropus TaxID=634121 RepID=UPI0032B2EA4E
MQKTFLVEIGTEELPPKSLRLLAETFAKNFKDELKKSSLQYEEVIWYASPRRLAIKVINLALYQTNHEIKKRGPSIIQSFNDNGEYTKIAKKWAQGCGITLDQSERLVTNKGEWLFYRTITTGKLAKELLNNIVNKAINNLPFQKMMRWGNNKIEFVRPVHTVVMLLGKDVVKGKVFGVESGRIVFGHRFMGKDCIILNSAKTYPSILYKSGKVIVDYQARKELIKYKIKKIAEKLGGFLKYEDDLLEEVTALVEWPVILSAKFEKKFLLLPKEVLVHIMINIQKYFPVFNQNGDLMTDFIFVANIKSLEPKKIILGNAKVIRSRLADAEYLFMRDREKKIEENFILLKTVLFQKHLGTLLDKTNRVVILSVYIAKKIGANINHVNRASLLSKCDLMSHMVFEFPELQGIIGMHYARLDGEIEDVALAIKEQYQPRFSGDFLPSTKVSIAVALADKIDMLVGSLGMNQHPKGDKDPFALRRVALGIFRIIVESSYELDLLILAKEATKLYGNKLINENVVDNVVKFVLGRCIVWYKEQGYCLDVIQSVLVCFPTKPKDFDARLKAVTYFRTLSIAKKLIIMNKRVSKILKKTNEKLNVHVITSFLKAPEEILLATNVGILQDKLLPLLSEYRYEDILMELVSLNEMIDNFFDNVIVMDNDKSIRINRLTLLSHVRALFLQVGDFSLLQ